MGTCVCVPSTACALPAEVLPERLLLARGLRVGVDEHEVGAERLQLRDGPIGRLERRDRRPVHEDPPEHVE